MRATQPIQLFLIDLNIIAIFGETYTNYEAPHYAVISNLLLLLPS